MKRNRVLNAAARFLRTLPSQVLLQPHVGRSAYERPKHSKSTSIILSDNLTANAVRLLASRGFALAAIYWIDLGAIGFFVAIAGGLCAYAALTAVAMHRVKEPSAQPMK
jgi:hypothetical protein